MSSIPNINISQQTPAVNFKAKGNKQQVIDLANKVTKDKKFKQLPKEEQQEIVLRDGTFGDAMKKFLDKCWKKLKEFPLDPLS